MVGRTPNDKTGKRERFGEMIFWSQGLGENSLNIPIGDAEMVKEGDLIYIKGKMGAPVFWDFKVTLREEDLKDIFIVVQDPNTAGFLVNSENHWNIYLKIVKGALRFALTNVKGLVKNSFRK